MPNNQYDARNRENEASTSKRKSSNIAIVGHAGSGKTTCLAGLEDAFKGTGWTLSFAAPPNATEEEKKIYEESHTYVVDLKKRIDDGFFPTSTPMKNEPNEVWCALINGSRRIELRTFDPAGQLFSNERHKENQEAYYSLLDRLRECDGAIVLLDPKLDENSWNECWDKIKFGLHDKSNGQFYGPRLAICISKSDELVWQQRFRIRNARRWVEQNRTKMIDVFEKRLGAARPSECRWYFISAVGWHNGTPNVHYFVDSHPIIDQDIADKAESAPTIPAPAASLARMLKENERNPVFESRLKSFYPLFTSPMQFIDVDTEKTAIFDVEESELSDDPKDRAKHTVRGIHIGFGGVDRGNENNDVSYVRTPWNVAEPLLWLAEALERK